MKTFNGKLIGFLTIGEKSINEEITNDDIFTLTLFCDYISIVFDNFFLYSEIAYQKKYQEFLLENLPLGIIGVEKDGKINLLNNYGEKILKVVFNEVKGKKIEKVGSQIADIVRKALMYGEKVYRIEINYIPGKIILGLSTNIIKDDSGNIIGAMCVFQDITKIKELEKKETEMETNNYWSLISSRLSHELKNPLVAINTFAQMLPNMYDDKEFREKFSGIVIEEVKRINEIVNMINNIGEDIEIKGEEIDFNKFLDEFVSEKDIEKRNLYNLDLVIKGDILKLKEAFSNIFEFIKEDNEKNKIFMEVIKTENLLKIIFSEKGEKIKIMDEDEIFIPFNPKLEPKLSIKMLIARKIIEKHHGELKIEISPQGKNFIITLPLKNE
ncbi:MAG: PAS domain S-box protein [bacterium]|nr:PAS domain S-box protein [bacterium]MDW8164475.1 PAS domain S-box protein [Candidatus Omnitrophota bacterium]